MKKLQRLLFAAIACLAFGFATTSKADLVLTASGLMTYSAFGYTNGQPVSFTFTLTENAVFGYESLGTSYSWQQFIVFNDPPLYSSVTGTDLVVTSEPTFTSRADAGFDGSDGYFVLTANALSAVGPNGTTTIDRIVMGAYSPLFATKLTPIVETVPTPYSYLRALAGAYSRADLSSVELQLSGPSGFNLIMNSSMSLSIVDTGSGPSPGPGPAAVPEPGTWAAAALLAGGAAFVRWRKRRVA